MTDIRLRRILPEVLTFIETKLFTSLVPQYLTDDEYAALQQALVTTPDAGDVIRGSGGVRKLRWRVVAGRGKRGGIRVIYYLRTQQGEIWMLTSTPRTRRRVSRGTS